MIVDPQIFNFCFLTCKLVFSPFLRVVFAFCLLWHIQTSFDATEDKETTHLGGRADVRGRKWEQVDGVTRPRSVAAVQAS